MTDSEHFTLLRRFHDIFSKQDEFSDDGEGDNVGQKFITVHRSVTHIGVINGPVVIGPQFNNTHNPMQPSTWYNQQVSFNFYISLKALMCLVANSNTTPDYICKLGDSGFF